MENKAGFVLRAAAYLVDIFLVSLLFSPLMALLSKDRGGLDSVTGLVFLVYSSLATGMYGMTLGKRFFHLKVVREDGSKPSMGTAFLRDFLGKLISGVVLSLGFLWVIWDKNKQGWHDKIAKTFVVQYEAIGGGRKFLAYLVVCLLPILAILAIVATFLLVAINPAAQLKKAQEAVEKSGQIPTPVVFQE